MLAPLAYWLISLVGLALLGCALGALLAVALYVAAMLALAAKLADALGRLRGIG